MAATPFSNQSAEPPAIDFWKMLQVIIRNRVLIIRNCLIVLLFAVALSFILPKKYKAVTTLLPPEQMGQMGSIKGIPMDLMGGLDVFNFNTTADLFVQILRSRTVQQAVLLQKYPCRTKSQTLMEYFNQQTIEAGIIKLNSVTAIQASKEGIISIEVELGVPELAAGVANAYASVLDSVNRSKSTSRAKSSRLYIEEQLRLTNQRLERADQLLAEFMRAHKAVALEDQTRTAIEELGALKGQIIAKEVELALKLQIRKANHLEILALKTELAELNKQYLRLQYGDSLMTTARSREFYIPMAQVPDVALQQAELMREVKVQETVFQLLNQQYYQTKIQEAKDTPTVQVLDEAVPPKLKSKPRRLFLILLAVSTMFILSIFWAFAAEYFANLPQAAENRKKIDLLKQLLHTDWENLKQYLRRRLLFLQRTDHEAK